MAGFVDQFWTPGNGISLRIYTMNVDFVGHESDTFWIIYMHTKIKIIIIF